MRGSAGRVPETGDGRKNDLMRAQERFFEGDVLSLSKAIRALINLRPKANIYKFIAETLQRLLSGSLVFVSTYDEMSFTLYVRAAAGLGNNADKVICLLGRHPVGVSVQMNDAARNGLGKGRLEIVSGGLHELTTGALPLKVCASIESLINITGVYAMGLTWDGRIMGSVAILMQGGSEIASPTVVESFVNYAAVALRRRHEAIVDWV
ncbi:hypothetical protein ACFLV1_02855 [Chloroflexota bacterium]